MRVFIKKDYEEVSLSSANLVTELVKAKPDCALGLATGSTPLGLYGELVRLYSQGDIDFSGVTTFNLDEYYGIDSFHPQSYRRFMEQNLFEGINIKREQTFVPDGTVALCDIEDSCARYEELIEGSGGIDLQILGIGGDGHIGFNEPGSSFSSRTRLVALNQQTVRDNARFFDNLEDVPKFAVSMGISTILQAREIVLLATGEKKAKVLAEAIEGPLTCSVTASALQWHPRVTVIVDECAASCLQRKDYYKFAEHSEQKIGYNIF